MDIASILLASILIGGFIAIATGVAAILGTLQMASGGGLRHLPPETSASIIARQRAVDARLRARYLQRQPMARHEPVSLALQVEEPIDEQPKEPAAAVVPSEQGGMIGPLAERLAG